MFCGNTALNVRFSSRFSSQQVVSSLRRSSERATQQQIIDWDNFGLHLLQRRNDISGATVTTTSTPTKTSELSELPLWHWPTLLSALHPLLSWLLFTNPFISTLAFILLIVVLLKQNLFLSYDSDISKGRKYIIPAEDLNRLKHTNRGQIRDKRVDNWIYLVSSTRKGVEGSIGESNLYTCIPNYTSTNNQQMKINENQWKSTKNIL